MLAKAVKEHQAPSHKSGSILAQQLFPSSSPIAGYGSSRIPTQQPPYSSVVGLTKSGRLEKLHEAVSFDDFDENDFPDDADLDLDVEDSGLKKHLVASNLQPPLPAFRSTSPKKPPSSSQPISWSSSPLEHKAPLQKSTSHKDPPSSLTVTDTAPGPKELVSADTLPRPSKRRTLPWLDTAEDNPPKEQIRGPPPHIEKLINCKRSYEMSHGGNVENISFTPLPRDKPYSPYPWNKTASAMKEEQKRLRQTNKKLVKKNAPADNTVQEAVNSRRRPKIAEVFLSDEQQKVLTLVSEGRKSVFFTGSAGTGKSVLLRQIIRTLRENHARESDRVAVTASTGLAACNVGGVTLHSFGGIGLGKEAVPELVKKIKRNQKAKQRWLRTKILIIDEISMVDGELFDKLEAVARSIRNNGRPFGGIQLVITGDFFQLPPVPDYGKVAKFAFDAATWNTSIEHTIGLNQVFRQKDPAFANMLNEMRLGKLSQKSVNTFKSLERPLSFTDDLEATELFPTRNEVDAANNNRLRNLVGITREFRAIDGGTITDHVQRDKLLSNCMAPPLITLKKGAQVMLIKNIDETLVNGSLGKVMGFMDEKTFDYYHENEEEFQAVERMDPGDEERTRSRKKLKAFMNRDTTGDTSQTWPLVRFAIADGTFRDLLCQNESWKIELPNGEVQASRSQVPLIMAWALSIHKAQGQTLERVKVDMGRIFEKGQAYVALSRATCQEGLQITRFDPSKVMAHEKVRNFYESLYGVDTAVRATVSTKSRAITAEKYEKDYMKDECSEDEDAVAQMYG